MTSNNESSQPNANLKGEWKFQKEERYRHYQASAFIITVSILFLMAEVIGNSHIPTDSRNFYGVSLFICLVLSLIFYWLEYDAE